MFCGLFSASKHHKHGIGFGVFHCRSRALCTSGGHLLYFFLCAHCILFITDELSDLMLFLKIEVKFA